MSEHAETRVGRLAAALDEFLHSSPDVEAAAVVSFDGLPMASALPDDLDEDRVGAMSAALLSLGEQAALGLGRGQLSQVFVEGEHGFVFLMSARDQAVLAAVAGRSTKLGFLLFEMRRAADRVGQVLESGAPAAAWSDPDDADLAPSADVVALLGGAAAPAAEPAAPVVSAPTATAEPDLAVAPPEPATPSALTGILDGPEPSAVSPSPDAPAPAAPAPAVPPPGAPLAAVPDHAPWEADPAPAAGIPPFAPEAAAPPSGADAAAVRDAHEADLLAVLASEPLTNRFDEAASATPPAPAPTPAEDRDLLTEALFEMRRASGDTDDNAWSAPPASSNGWG